MPEHALIFEANLESILIAASVVGAIVSSTVLRPAQTNLTSDEDIGLYCGINDCPSNNFTSTNLEISSNAVRM